MFADPTAYSPDLSHHLRQCAQARGRLHTLRCGLEALDGFLSPRFVSLIAAATALSAVLAVVALSF